MLELVGETSGLGWVAVKAVLVFAVAVIGRGAVALVTLLVVHRLVALARRHSRIARIIDHPPRVLSPEARSKIVNLPGPA